MGNIMDRRTALTLIARFSVASVVPSTWLMGCGGEPESGSNGDCSDGAEVRYMKRFNELDVVHDHSEITISPDVVDAAIPGIYKVLGRGDGEGDHTHLVDLSDKNFNSLKSGDTISKLTVDNQADEHTHTVHIAC